MKVNACMLLRVTCEQCIGLCHKDNLKMKTTGTSCVLCVHIHHVTSLLMRMSTDAYTMMIIIIMPCMILEGLLTSGRRCVLCVHIHHVTSLFMMMSTDAYTMMMIIIMPCMILEGLLTSGRRSEQLA